MQPKYRPLTKRELESIRISGKILSAAMTSVVEAVRPGVSAQELNRIAEAAIREHQGEPSFKGYRGFPASLCVSRNDEVVHGIPREGVRLQSGDIVGLDLGVVFKGLYTDMATSVPVGKVSSTAQRLLDVTRASLEAGLEVVRNGNHTGDIGAAIQAVVAAAGFQVVRDLVGHGVGRDVHEDPAIPNFGEPGTGSLLRSGQAIAIEPMVTAGSFAIKTDPDGWTVRTSDGGLAAHEERTVLVTDDGYELLTEFY
ncbi:MAG: type I methionyl aminopeptidase [Candidatus Kerfeldbacteria bacterium]|nr:type I methionyl aminopeptidase [Candidatus Kerfeldbacteria bacterium]